METNSILIQIIMNIAKIRLHGWDYIEIVTMIGMEVPILL